MLSFVDLSTIMIAGVILDIEVIVVLVFNLSQPLHGFFHTYFGATLVAITLSIVLWPLRKFLNDIVILLGIHQESNYRMILFGSLIGTESHVFLDSFLYLEMNPFYPLLGNPFLDLIPSVMIYDLCIITGILGLVLYVIRILYRKPISFPNVWSEKRD